MNYGIKVDGSVVALDGWIVEKTKNTFTFRSWRAYSYNKGTYFDKKWAKEALEFVEKHPDQKTMPTRDVRKRPDNL